MSYFSGSAGARAVVSVAPARETALLDLARAGGVPALAVGTVGQPDGEFALSAGKDGIRRPIDRLRKLYFDAIPRRMRAGCSGGMSQESGVLSTG